MQKNKVPHLKWQRLPGHRSLRGRAGHTANLVGKHIYVLGGRNGNEFFNDMWAFDTEVEEWKLIQAKAPFPPRAYHTSTLVNECELWVIGGSDHRTMYSDVHVFDTISKKWSSPVTTGNSSNKQRGTHAAVLHPFQTNSILVFGGYGGTSWLSDLVLFHTDTLEWEELKPEGTCPSGRGYHTLTAVGSCAVLFGGKAEGGILKDDMLSIYDAATNRWSIPSVKGERPSPRSNHASAFLKDGLVIVHGGRHGSLRLNDAYALKIPPFSHYNPSLELQWHLIERAKVTPVLKKGAGKKAFETAKADSPSGRSAHGLVSKGQALYIFGGYGGQGLTFDDMFVLRKLPNLPEEGKIKRSPYKLSGAKFLINTDEDMEEAAVEEGWRSTKRPKLHVGKQLEADSTVAAARLLQKKLDVGFGNSSIKTHETSDTRSTEPMIGAVGHPERKIVSLIEDKSPVSKEKLSQNEVKSLQQTLESLKATIKEKTLADSEFHGRSVQLEQQLQRLQKENSDLQFTVGESKKEITLLSKRTHKLEAENKAFKASIQDLEAELGERETARQMEVLNAREQEKKLKDVSKSLEDVRAVASEAVLERNKYKTCMETLEGELEKQMDTLRQLSSRYETEKAFLLKEVAERKSTADKLLTELGASKEYSRALEETLNCQAKQIEQEASRVDVLQKEKEEVNCSKAVLASEYKQLVEAKEGVEANSAALRSELQVAQLLIDQKEAEILRLKGTEEQTKEHVSTLHNSLNKKDENLRVQMEENEKLRVLIRESEDLARSIAEKLRCARQSCPC